MGRKGGRSGVHSGGHSLQCVHPLTSTAPTLSLSLLSHYLGADIKEMGVSKGGWSASETRLVVAGQSNRPHYDYSLEATTPIPPPRRRVYMICP